MTAVGSRICDRQRKIPILSEFLWLEMRWPMSVMAYGASVPRFSNTRIASSCSPTNLMRRQLRDPGDEKDRERESPEARAVRSLIA